MPRQSRMIAATLAAFVLGVALMIPFESTVTRVLGVLALLAYIVLGVFTIATPELLGEQGPDEEGPDADQPRESDHSAHSHHDARMR